MHAHHNSSTRHRRGPLLGALAAATATLALVAGTLTSASATPVAQPATRTAKHTCEHRPPVAIAATDETDREQRIREREDRRTARAERKWHRAHCQPKPTEASKVLSVAASKAGAPYRYGAAGPTAFDCSGYTQWVFRHVGEALPHSSKAQVARTTRIAAKDRRAGDLVFFHNAGGVYHVGIYAGSGTVWHAPRPGEAVHRAKIWTGSVFYGRVK